MPMGNKVPRFEKVVTTRFISAFFNNIITYNKSNEFLKKIIINDLVLVVVKGLFPLNTIENIWMKQFGLRRDPQLVFPSCKTLIKEVFPCMVKHALEKFVSLYINVAISITTTFDL
jgi:hypothetical protein